MRLSDLLQDESLRRAEFPVSERKVFLAHAAVSPLPRRVIAAVQHYLEAAGGDDQEAVVPDATLQETRALAARLIEATPREIAFTGSTSMGLGMVAAGLPWRAGENVVCYKEDYPANVYPWMNLAVRGVEVRFVIPKIYGKITVDDLHCVVDDRTRLVSLSSVHFLSGWRLAVDTIGSYLRDRGILFCLDGIQSFGALRTSVRHVDFAAADAHKWLLGPIGVAILFVRGEHHEHFRPPLVGWHNALCPEFITRDEVVFRADARRYEPGSLNLAGIIGLRAALQLINELGIDAIEQRVLALALHVINECRKRDFTVLGPVEMDGLSGIVSVKHRGLNAETLHRWWLGSGIHTSLRKTARGSTWLRFSPHAYNLESELEQSLDRRFIE